MDQRERLIQDLTAFYREAATEASFQPPKWRVNAGHQAGWLQPVLASAALVLVVVGAAVGLRIARDQAKSVTVKPTPTVIASPSAAPTATPTTAPSATPSPIPLTSWIAQRVPIAGQVYFRQAMALDSSAVFALYTPTSNNPHDNSRTTLARVDRTTGKLVTNGPFPGGFQLLRVGAGLWVLGGMNGGPAVDKYWMDLVDPVTLQVRSRVWVPGHAGPTVLGPPDLTGASNIIWLGYGQQLFRLDPSTGKVMATVNVPGTVSSVSLDAPGKRLYLGVVPPPSQTNQQAQVLELEGTTGRLLTSARTGGGDLGGPQVVASADGVWVAYATGMMGQVEHRSAANLALLPNPSQVGHTNGIDVVVGGSSVWYLDGMAQQVACADPRTGAIASTADIAFPAALVADAKGTYAAVPGEIDFLNPNSCPNS
jgi:hypothetical protein